MYAGAAPSDVALNRMGAAPAYDAPPYNPYAPSGALYPPEDDRRRYSDATLADPDAADSLMKPTDGYAPVPALGYNPAPRSGGGRTPSPTPEEAAALAKIGKAPNLRNLNVRQYLQRKYLLYWIAGVTILVVALLFVIFEKQIIRALQPAANWMHNLKFGWLIPIGVMVVISFPPLFGHEVVAILAGLVWGLWEGFGIVAAGTFLGELANFFVFKWWCNARAEKLTRTNLSYASLARAITDGGFPVVLIARYSAVPGHLLTAIFSTCGMALWVFAASAILGLPKQLFLVYIGVALEESENGQNTTTEKVVKVVLFIVTFAATIFAMRFLRQRTDAALVKIVYERRKARQVDASYPPFAGSAQGDEDSVSYDDPYKPPVAAPRPLAPYGAPPRMVDPYDEA